MMFSAQRMRDAYTIQEVKQRKILRQ